MMTTQNVKVFMLDNLDSFTYNLVDEFRCLGFDPVIYRNTLPVEFILEQIKQYQGQAIIVLSPGPGEPSNAGCLMALIKNTVGKYPILGICLGHQALIEHFGGKVIRAPEIVHGKASNIEHNAIGPFKDIIQPLPVARYHSLIGSDLPAELDVIAKYSQGDITMPMAIAHNSMPILAYQFHPESILTTYGSTLLNQSIDHLLSLVSTNNIDGVIHD